MGKFVKAVSLKADGLRIKCHLCNNMATHEVIKKRNDEAGNYSIYSCPKQICIVPAIQDDEI